jgi:hypothetical protein
VPSSTRWLPRSNFFKPEPLGENATRDFLLRNIFRLDPAQIQNDVDLLRALLRRHYSSKAIPKSLDDRLIYLLRATGRWQSWPLGQIVPSRASFLEFLQERWPIFVRHTLETLPDGAHEAPAAYDLRYAGPIDLPFDHDDVRVYIDNLFTDGLLTPITGISRSRTQGTWISVGIASSDSADQISRFRKLLQLIEQNSPSSSSDHQTWMQASIRWAELVALRWSLPEEIGSDEKDRFIAARQSIEQAFQGWMGAHYATLHSLSFLPRPVMLHHVPRYMAHRLAVGESAKLAILVIDGLAMDQWAVVRQEMPTNKWITEEFGLFAWVPTLTSVSRQSIFAGDPPFYFGASLDTTRRHCLRLSGQHGRGRCLYCPG